jgi:hypothetical protein
MERIPTEFHVLGEGRGEDGKDIDKKSQIFLLQNNE